jgi:hypothetical protein
MRGKRGGIGGNLGRVSGVLMRRLLLLHLSLPY